MNIDALNKWPDDLFLLRVSAGRFLDFKLLLVFCGYTNKWLV